MTPAEVVGPVPPGRDEVEYDRLRRRILWMFPTGLYVLGSRSGSRRNLMTISWVTQVSLDPKLVAASVERHAVTRGLVEEGGSFSVSVLPRTERALVRRFAKPVTEEEIDERTGKGTMEGAAVRSTGGGAPVLADAVAWIDCALRHQLDLGSHTLFVGEVTDCGITEELAGVGSERGAVEVLRMEDTRMSYGG